MFFCVFSQGATSSPPAVSAADSSAVRELAHSLKARVGMAAEMLDTGETVMVGDEAAYPMQSVVKFVLALSVLKRVDQGAMNLEQIIRIRPEQLVKDTWSPLRERFPQGGDFSLKELLRVTVQESDNNTCDLLFGLIGGPQAVQKDLKEWGIDGINVRFTEEEIHRNHDLQYVNSSRPSAMNSLLRAFDEGKILKKGTQSVLWNIMAGCSTGPERLKGQLRGITWWRIRRDPDSLCRGVALPPAMTSASLFFPTAGKWRFPCSSGIQRILNPLVTG